MNFLKLLTLMENDIEKTRNIKNPALEPTRVDHNKIFSSMPPIQKPATNSHKKMKFKPINDFLMNIKIGQDANVDIPGNEKGWTVETKGQNFVRLAKNPTKTNVGGSLVVPNEIYMQWQLNKFYNPKKQTQINYQDQEM